MTQADLAIAFGDFEFNPSRQLLLRAGVPVRLGSRAMAILELLTARAGEVVTKDELMAHVWPNAHVDEGALRVHLVAVRKALGDGQGDEQFIVNLAGRGYCFTQPTQTIKSKPNSSSPRRQNVDLPQSASAKIVGRSEVIKELASLCTVQRVLTVTGAGGIGKTTVAVGVASALAHNFRDGICFVDLAPLSNGEFVAGSVSSALATLSGEVISDLSGFLRDKECLIVLDNCEHIIDGVAKVVEDILRLPSIHVLATSREPLRTSEEWVYRLASLATSPTTSNLTSEEALTFPAIELFERRASANSGGFVLRDADSPIVAHICRRLDGLPLAIELAAARVNVLGVAGIAAWLDDRFAILTRGRRTALPRQQTLEATLDWSYDLLPRVEQIILESISVFRGSFDLHSAVAVSAGARSNGSELLDDLASLVEKSLLSVDFSGEKPTYRLLETTRAYAYNKLVLSGEDRNVIKRHARYVGDFFSQAETHSLQSDTNWRSEYGSLIDDVRGALDWCFGPDGDSNLGVDLTASSARLWLELYLMNELQTRAVLARERLKSENPVDRARELRILATVGLTTYSEGRQPKAAEALSRAATVAEELNDPVQQYFALRGLFVDHCGEGKYSLLQNLAHQIADCARRSSHPDPDFILEHQLTAALHLSGDQFSAQASSDRKVHHPLIENAQLNGFDYKYLISHRCFRARIFWIRGYPDQALIETMTVLDEAIALGHSPSFQLMLSIAASPILIWCGKLALAEHLLVVVKEGAATGKMESWHEWQRYFEVALRLLRNPEASKLGRQFMAAHEESTSILMRETLATMHASFLTRSTIARAQEGVAGWCAPEILRLLGEAALEGGEPSARDDAQALFVQARDLAAKQGALSWELRIAMSQARLGLEAGRIDEAREDLEAVYNRFKEGFTTQDLVEAVKLLQSLK